jgi:chaperonin GroES
LDQTTIEATTEDPATPDTDAKAPYTSADLLSNIEKPNLCDDISDEMLVQIGRDVVRGYEIDLESRKAEGWDDLYKEAVNLAKQTKEGKDYPWPKAANVKFPLVTTAAIQFAARAYPAIIDGFNVVKCKVLGKPDDDKKARAERVSSHMSWQLMERMPEWEGDTDQLLHMLPVVGCMFRKVWHDPVQRCNVSEIRLPDKVVVNYWAKANPPRQTDVLTYYPNEIETKFRSGIWMRQEFDKPASSTDDDHASHEFLEQHCLLDLDGDKYAEPYIVTVHKDSAKVVRIVTRYYPEGITLAEEKGKQVVVEIEPCDHFIKYEFMPSFDGSYYGMGFGILLASINETINSTINQLLDAGHMSNLQSGFVDKGVKMKAGDTSFRPGEWKRVDFDATGKSLKDSVFPLPVREPSAVLFNLLGLMIDAAKDITATKDILTGETQGSNQAVGTTLAMIEQGLKVYTSIVKRVHRALKDEVQVYAKLNGMYLDDKEYFEFQDAEGVVGREDYNDKDLNVLPMSDPTMATDMQRMARAEYMRSFMGQGLNDMEIVKRSLEAGGIQDIQGLMPKEAPKPDPEFVLKTKELEIKEREVAIKEREGEATTKQAYADLAKTDAETRKITAETIMADPEMFALLRQLIDESVAQMAEVAAPVEAEQPDEAIPGTDGGMEEPPNDEADLPISDGLSEPVGEPMGAGPADDLGAAGPGQEPGSVDQPLA